MQQILLLLLCWLCNVVCLVPLRIASLNTYILPWKLPLQLTVVLDKNTFFNHWATYITRTVYGGFIGYGKSWEFSDFLFLWWLGVLELSTFTAYKWCVCVYGVCRSLKTRTPFGIASLHHSLKLERAIYSVSDIHVYSYIYTSAEQPFVAEGLSEYIQTLCRPQTNG
jgi:hypothetical protein